MQLVFNFLPFEAFFTILFQLFDPKESWKFSLQINSPCTFCNHAAPVTLFPSLSAELTAVSGCCLSSLHWGCCHVLHCGRSMESYLRNYRNVPLISDGLAELLWRR
jgi:hypothetical protein